MTPPTAEPVIRIRDARCGRLTVHDGELALLLGPSESGKTTLMRAMVGVGGPLDEAFVLGRRVTAAAMAEVAGWVPEGDGVFLSETVWANVAGTRKSPVAAPDRAADALDLVGLAERAADPVAALSPGGRRRVALARAIARRRPVLLIDGPLDPTLWVHFPMILDSLPWLRATVIALSSADELIWKAQRIAMVGAGRILAEGSAAEMMASADPVVREAWAWVTR